MRIIDCKRIREDMLKEAREKIASIPKNLKLAIVQVGNDPASEVYIRNKIKTADIVGIDTELFTYPDDIEVESLKRELLYLSCDGDYTGIILQLPLPDQLKPYERELLDLIPYYKDVDGLSSESVGRLWSDKPCITPATPTGLLRLLPEDLSGKDVVIVNRSNLIGKPLIKMLLDRNATVEVCHSKTDYLSVHTCSAEIVITGIGKAEYFDELFISSNQIWIDCGINRNENGELCGDVDIDYIETFGVSITPVPGGVGILTTAQLMLNVIKAYELPITVADSMKELADELKIYAETHNLTIDELLLLIEERLGGR